MNTFRPELIGRIAGALVLDVGSGGGRHVRAFGDLGARVIAADVAAPSASEGVVADAHFLPFRDDSFDVVIISEVLEHVGEPERVLAESVRVLRRAGTLAISVPSLLPEAVNWLLSLEYHSAPGGHVRIFSGARLERMVGDCGMAIYREHRSHAIHTPYWWLKSLLGIERSARAPLVQRYEWQLIAEISGARPDLSRADRWLNPLIGKSLAIYARRPGL